MAMNETVVGKTLAQWSKWIPSFIENDFLQDFLSL